MIPLKLTTNENSSLKILCLGAHSDDIEIGCGGTILKLLQQFRETEITWIVLSGNSKREIEARKSGEHFLENAKNFVIITKNFKDAYFPYTGEQIKDYFEEIKQMVSPDLIFTHYRYDLHQDHRLVCELTWNTFRNHLILEYEVVKYDGDLGAPNCFFHLDEEICKRKISYILNCFGTQGSRCWFTEDVFFAILRLRGLESNSPSLYSEGFYCRKMIL